MTGEHKKWIFEEWLAAYGNRLHEISAKRSSRAELQQSEDPVKKPPEEDLSST